MKKLLITQREIDMVKNSKNPFQDLSKLNDKLNKQKTRCKECACELFSTEEDIINKIKEYNDKLC